MPTLSEQMAADALDAMKLSRKFFVVELDYSLASLEKLEEMFDQWRYALPGGDTPENVEKLVRVWGAYAGEVVRRSSGGEWVSDPGEHGKQLALRTATGDINPHDLIHRRLSGETKEVLADSLRRMKDKG